MLSLTTASRARGWPSPHFDHRQYPEDIWRAVFDALFQISDRTRKQDGRFFRVTQAEKNILAASDVCSLFRRIIHETPACWTVVSYCGPYKRTNGIGASLTRFKNSLERSKQLKIDVLLCINATEGHKFVRGIDPLIDIMHDDPIVSRVDLSALFALLLVHIRRIERLSVLGDYRTEFQSRTMWPKDGHPLSQMRNEPWTGLPLSGLKSLILKCVLFLDVNHLLLFLRHSPQLEELEMQDDVYFSTSKGRTQTWPPLRLNFLTTLSITTEMLLSLVQIGLVTPSLQYLDTRYSCAGLEETALPNFTFARSITSLKLHALGEIDVDLNDELLGIILPIMPGLKVLELEQWYGGCALVDLLCKVEGDGLSLVRRLEHLKIKRSDLTDAYVRKLLNARTYVPGSAIKTLMVHLVNSSLTTSELGEELIATGRGSRTVKDEIRFPPDLQHTVWDRSIFPN